MSRAQDSRLLRLSAGYMLDQLPSARVIFDVVDALIVVAVGQANVAPVSASPELQLRYATYDQAPPDELRRPVSINAVAQSLRLPFETVRRRLIKLSLLGACQSTRAGLIVPSRVLFAGVHQNHLERNDRLTAALWGETCDDLALPPEKPRPAPAWTEPPLRITSRLALDYVLRFADRLGQVFGDPTSVAVFAAVIEADGQPISMQAIARRVQLSAETVRRRTHELAARSVVEITPTGVVAAAEFMASDAMNAIVSGNRGDLVRLFATLRDLGVVAHWQAGSRDKAA